MLGLLLLEAKCLHIWLERVLVLLCLGLAEIIGLLVIKIQNGVEVSWLWFGFLEVIKCVSL